MLAKLAKIADKVSPGTFRSLSWEMLLSSISFPASVLLNRALGAEDRGLLAVVTLIPSTIFVIGSCQWDRIIQGSITSREFSSPEAWRRTVYYSLRLSLIFAPLGFLASLMYTKLAPDAQWLSAIYCINFPIYFLGGSLAAIYIAAGSVDGQYWMRIGLQGSYLFLLFGLMLVKQVSVLSMVVVYIAMHFISLLIGWKMKTVLLKGKILKEIPPYKPLIVAFFPYLLESFSTRIDIWAFSWFSSLANLGQYTGVTALMLPVGLVSKAMTSSSTANLKWTHPESVGHYLSKSLLVLGCLLFLLVIGGMWLGPYVLESLLGKSFSSGYWMIPWVAVIVVMQAATVQFHTALRLSGNMGAYLSVQAFEPFIRLILVLLLGWCLSDLGIMLGIIISSTLKIIACFILRKLKLSEST